MNDDLMSDDGSGWAVAGILCELEGAVLTASIGDGGLAGRIEMCGALALAANDERFGRIEQGEAR